MRGTALAGGLLLSLTVIGTPARAQPEPARSAGPPAATASRGFGIAVVASTLGAGLEGIVPLTQSVNLRGRVNVLAFSHALHNSGNSYHGSIDFLSGGLLGDWYPLSWLPVLRHLRLTGGIYVNENTLDVVANCDQGCSAGNDRVVSTPGGAARFLGHMRFDTASPYAGFGFGNALQGGRLHAALDVGVLFQGSPKVDLGARGSATVTAGGVPVYDGDLQNAPAYVQDQIDAEQQRLRDKLHRFRFYPVLGITLGYRFGGASAAAVR